MKKRIFGFLALVGAIIFLYFGLQPLLQKSKPFLKKITVYQKIVKSKTDKQEYDRFYIGSGKTALDLLKQTTSLKTKGEGKNAFVIMIDNYQVSQNKKEYWAFYINGQYAQVGAGSYILKNNDKIEWRIDSY